MEDYQCSNDVSTPFIQSSGKNGGTSDENPILSSSSAEDIWADFDCVIELGHQVKREERMRELNRVYLAQGPSPVYEDNPRIEVTSDDKKKSKGNATGDENIRGNPPSNIQKLQAVKKDEILSESVMVISTRANLKHQNEPSLPILNEDLNIIKADQTNEDGTEGPTDGIFSCADLLMDNATSLETVDQRFSPDEVHVCSDDEISISNQPEILCQPLTKARRNASTLKLQTMSMENDECCRGKEAYLQERMYSLTDSRITVPLNTPVCSFTAFQTSSFGCSPRDSYNEEIAENCNEWYARSIEHAKYVNNIEDDPNGELEELFKQCVLPDQVCPDRKTLSRSEIRGASNIESITAPECHIPKTLGLQESECSIPRNTPEDFNMSPLNESDDESRPSRTDKNGFTKMRKVESAANVRICQTENGGRFEPLSEPYPKKEVVTYCYNADGTDLASVENYDDISKRQVLRRKSEKVCKPHINVIVVQPISGSEEENFSQHKNQLDDASRVIRKSEKSDISPRNQQRRNLRLRIGQVILRASGKVGSAFRVCTGCCR